MEKNNNTDAQPPIVLMNENNSIRNYKQVIPVSIYHFYIVEEIGEVEPYLDMINTLKCAEQHDTVYICLNTPGGSLDTTIQIISAIKQAACTVVCVLEGPCASAATLIFLSGHKYIINPHCSFMIHNYSHGLGGKGNEVALQVKFSEEYFKKLATEIYGGFLTEKEINDVISGIDMWMDSEKVIERLKQSNKVQNLMGEKNESVVEDTVLKILESATTKKPKSKKKIVKKPVKKK